MSMIGYEKFIVSQPGETWIVTRACPEHRHLPMVGRPFRRVEGPIHPCMNGCWYEQMGDDVQERAKQAVARIERLKDGDTTTACS